jgi:hypothetical protein
MNISPEDRNKTFALIAAVVVVFGFGIWRVMGLMAPSDTPPPAVTQIQLPSGTLASNATPGAIVDVVIPTTAGQIDPFRKVVSDTISTPPSAGTTFPRPRPDFGPPVGGSGSHVPIFPEGVPQDMTIVPKLTGVMTGGNPMGVFVVAGKEEVVGVGDSLSTGFTVLSITRDGATVRKGKQTLKLRLSS